MLAPWDPLGYKVGHFRQARRRVLPDSMAAGPLWEFRWGSATSLCFVTRITLKAVQNGATTVQEIPFNLKVARSFSLADSVQTTSILRSGNMQKMNTAFIASRLSEFVESSSATIPSGGTYTQDTDAIALGAYSTVATSNVDGSADTVIDFTPFWDGDQPLRFNANEGFIINLAAAGPTTSAGFTIYLEVCWVEAIKLP